LGRNTSGKGNYRAHVSLERKGIINDATAPLARVVEEILRLREKPERSRRWRFTLGIESSSRNLIFFEKKRTFAF
jgi:hypothetical protein